MFYIELDISQNHLKSKDQTFHHSLKTENFSNRMDVYFIS